MSATDLPLFSATEPRMHEVCGEGSYVFAFALAAQMGGQLLFVREGWNPTQINPVGFSAFIEPSNLILCEVKNQAEALAAGEEALRSSAVRLVVLALSQPVGLTEGRRLQIAARHGNTTGLAIIPEGMGSQAAQTRWRCTPTFDPDDSTLQRWDCIKNKTGTLGTWHVRWDAKARHICVVSPSGQ